MIRDEHTSPVNKSGPITDEELEEHIDALRQAHDRQKRMRAKMAECEQVEAEARKQARLSGGPR